MPQIGWCSLPTGASKFNANEKRELLKSLVESLNKPEGWTLKVQKRTEWQIRQQVRI